MRELHLAAAQRQLLQAGLDTPPSTGLYRRTLARVAWAEGLAVAEALRQAGVLSPKFWLRM